MYRCEARMCVSRETIVEPEEISQKLGLDRGQLHPDLGSLCPSPGRLGPALLGPPCSSPPRPVRGVPALLP